VSTDKNNTAKTQNSLLLKSAPMRPPIEKKVPKKKRMKIITEA
jgi:hypothetical protein